VPGRGWRGLPGAHSRRAWVGVAAWLACRLIVERICRAPGRRKISCDRERHKLVIYCLCSEGTAQRPSIESLSLAGTRKERELTSGYGKPPRPVHGAGRGFLFVRCATKRNPALAHRVAVAGFAGPLKRAEGDHLNNGATVAGAPLPPLLAPLVGPLALGPVPPTLSPSRRPL
jgi:hypothetical protein